MTKLRFWGHAPDDVGISGVGDREGAHTEVFSAGGSQLNVVPDVVVDSGLGQHGVVLDLRLPEGRSVVGNNDELGLAQPEAVEGLLVAQEALARLHDKGETRVDALIALLDLLLGSHLLGFGKELGKV